MPIPKPRGGETQSKFVSRCVGFLVGEGRAQNQAAAICYDTWRKKEEETMQKEGSKTRFQTDRFGGVTDYPEPKQIVSGGKEMIEQVEVDPDNPEHVIPRKEELDELFPVDKKK